MSRSRYGATNVDVAEILAGEPPYRIRQVWEALYRRRQPLESATELPRRLRARLASQLPLAFEPAATAASGDGLTTRWLWRARDGAQVETVLMRTSRRATVCVSSQAGCAMACPFCATGQGGFERHLDAGEIVEQVLRAEHESDQPVTNVVYMGMGEPLANYDAVWESVVRLHRDLAMSARHLTLSTVGVVPGMRRLSREQLPVTLAVSLHAPDDALRDTLVPLNRRYPLAEVLDAAAAVGRARGRRVTFEYAAIEGINDAPEQAEALAEILRPLGALGSHVNLIPLNPTVGYPGAAPSAQRLRAFAARLRTRGIVATVRRTRGTDIDAACGQLRWRRPVPHRPSVSARMTP